MKRRDFLKYSASTLVLPTMVTSLNASEYTTVEKQLFPVNFFNKLFSKTEDDSEKIEIKKDIENIEEEKIIEENEIVELEPVQNVKKKNDIFLEEKYLNEFVSVKEKLKSIQRYIGYGNFNIISFDDMIKIANNSASIATFSKEELNFLEYIFYYDPSIHGFYGERVSDNITQKINTNDVVKIPHTGHYLFKGEPEKVYYKMLDDIGPSLTLTSGVRSIVKQTKLFLDKIDSVNGNMAMASKSLAPPAFTYHSVADFDVGKKGLGFANFTPRFALTEEFIHMRKLKYIDMRYTINNKDGVRYEPWHVKVI
ncbi:MAG: hypothetical protein C0625_17375 [Arcobacter sp.]|nr:MAG: hypothetical protein C0625_17375 [Arcobacter sp.]